MNRHPFDPAAFGAGVVFGGLGLATLGAADLDLGELRWLVPIVLIVMGVALLLPVCGADDE